jgi:3-carboxy-cis,cis-muconate cycloisomerase
MMHLAPAIGRDAAHALVERAAAESRRSKQPLLDVLAAMPEVAAHLPADELRRCCSAGEYLGVAEALRLQLLGRGRL